MESVSKLVKQLVESDNFFEVPQLQEQILEHRLDVAIPALLERIVEGGERIKETLIRLLNFKKTDRNDFIASLLKYLRGRDSTPIRLGALQVLCEAKVSGLDNDLVTIAESPNEEHSLRLAALKALRDNEIYDSNLLSLVKFVKESQTKESPEILIHTLETLKVHSHKARKLKGREGRLTLEDLLTHASIDVRCKAIQTLGHFGDIDVLERVCLLPTNDEDIKKAIKKLVDTLISKPRNLLTVRPENFELVTKRVVGQIDGIVKVAHTGSSHDRGVDVKAYMKSKFVEGQEDLIVIQCKRYKPGNYVDKPTIEKHIKVMSEHRALQGLVITTSDFSKSAKELASKTGNLELMNGAAFQALVDRTFGEGMFCIDSQ